MRARGCGRAMRCLPLCGNFFVLDKQAGHGLVCGVCYGSEALREGHAVSAALGISFALGMQAKHGLPSGV